MTRLRSLVIGSFLILGIGLPAFGQDSLLGKLQNEIRGLARQAGPAVVKVTAERELRLPKHLLERMREFGNAAHLQKSVMVGTGFLISESGLVLPSNVTSTGGGVEAFLGFLRSQTAP